MDAFVFDLDGTLADTLEDIAAAMDRVLTARSFSVRSREEYRYFIGEGARRLVERSLPESERELTDQVLSEFRKDYVANMLVNTRPYKGIPALLDQLVAHDVPISVLSNKPHAMTVKMVEALFGFVPFAIVLGQRDDVPRKPDPAGAFEAAKAMGMAADRCAFVGDTKTDMQTANAASMLPVGVTWGFRDRAELEAHGARQLVQEPSQLAAVVGL